MKKFLCLLLVCLNAGFLLAAPEIGTTPLSKQKPALQAIQELFDQFADELVHLEDGTVDLRSTAFEYLDTEQHRELGVLLTVLNHTSSVPLTLASNEMNSNSRNSTTLTGPPTLPLSPSFCRCLSNCCTQSKCGVFEYVPLGFSSGDYMLIWHWQPCNPGTGRT